MLINWKVRAKNPTFWLTLIPALLLFIQACAKPLGYDLDLTGLQEDLLNIANAAFVVLGVLGIVIDPTTVGVSDSICALRYEKPIDQPEQLRNWAGSLMFSGAVDTSVTKNEEQGEDEKVGGTE